MEYEDIVHGCFNIPKDIEIIINTPQFQRLKNIKQLGIKYLMQPKANITRYEHCIGTYFLANQLVNSLENKTKDLKIPEFYKKAVTVAALLHDVGHGPFSHTWELICSHQFHHEENASGCIDQIFKICLPGWMTEAGYSIDYAIKLIKGFIKGDSSCLKDPEYRFLFEIVNNKQCDVDVDKWDYLNRDYTVCTDTVPDINVDFSDVFMEARVSDDRAHIEYRYYDFEKIYNIFNARATFHHVFYQDPLSVCLENLFQHIVSESENVVKCIKGIKITDIRSENCEAFLELNDDNIWCIIESLQSDERYSRLVKCLKNCSLTQIHPQTEEEKLAVPPYLKVESKIANPGEYMKEGNLFFYGDITEKPTFVQKKGYVTSVSYFRIDD